MEAPGDGLLAPAVNTSSCDLNDFKTKQRVLRIHYGRGLGTSYWLGLWQSPSPSPVPWRQDGAQGLGLWQQQCLNGSQKITSSNSLKITTWNTTQTSNHQNEHQRSGSMQETINNYLTRLSKISRFVSGEQINKLWGPFVGQVLGSRPMKRKAKMHRMIR